MNKAYRIIWNKARKCLMVVGENVKSSGKTSGGKKAIVDAVAMAVLALGGTAYSQTQTVSGVVIGPYPILNGNSLQVTPTGVISAPSSEAVYASGSVIGSINNEGSIGGGTNGIEIKAGALVLSNITNDGTITGVSNGVTFLAGSVVNNGITNTGLISSGGSGITAYSTSTIAGGINNSGTITAGNAIKLENSTLTGGMANTGYLEAGVFAISLVDSQLMGGVTNSGTINATQGIVLENSTISGGDISNTGAILTGNAAVNLNGHSAVANIVNSGTFTGANAVYISSSSITGSIQNQGLIGGYSDGINIGHSSVNQISNVSGVISGDRAIEINSSNILDGITNSGSMAGDIYGIVVNNSSISGGITNNIGGTITGAPGQGIVIGSGSNVDYISNIGGYINGVSNAGNIAGAPVGISLTSYALVDGGINNSGSISGLDTGFKLLSSTITGGVTNRGTITGGAYGGFVLTSSTDEQGSSISGGINNIGSISAGLNYDAVYIRWSTVSGGITNSGTITGAYDVTGTYSNGTGIHIASSSVIGGISNTGFISGGTNGVGVNGSLATVDFILNNGGTISGEDSGISIADNARISSGITNTLGGLIMGVNWRGIYISGNSTVDFIANDGGTISGDLAGIQLVGSSAITGGIVNSGSIGGGDLGIGLSGSSIIAGGVINSGSINGTENGIQIDSHSIVDFIANNGGTISGGSTGITLFTNSVITGGIINSGSIGGGYAGIAVLDSSLITGGITNTIGGTITGALGNGIVISPNSTVDYIANNGGYIGGINNAGTIGGSDAGISLTLNAWLDGGITNSGSIGGLAGIAISNSTVTGGITNSGTITGIGSTGGPGPSAGAINLVLSTVTGGIINSGLIQSDFAGIFLKDGSSVDAINNQGTIAALGGVALTNNSIVTNGITNSGSIGGLAGIAISNSTVTGGITNSGTITGVGGPGPSAGAINLLFSTVTGGINNSGLIQSDYVGIFLQNGSSVDAINNQGTIAALGGVVLTNSAIVTNGITNSGLISGEWNAIYLGGTTLSGGIQNSGAIIHIGSGAIGAYSTAITISGSTISGGITNTGLIASAYGNAIVVDGSSSDGTGGPIQIVNTNNGSQVGTIIGAINGYANVTNSGLWALQSYSTTTGYAGLGSTINSFVDGDYHQSSQGTLQFGVTNSGASTAYSTLNVSGTANFDDNATLNVVIAGPGIVGAGSVGGQINAGTLIVAPNWNVTDNSVLLNFNPIVSGTSLDLIATASGVTCFGTVSGPVSGPCLVGFDAPSIQVASTGSIGGSTIGIQVLTGLSDGAATSGYGIDNQGTVIGAQTGIRFSPSAILTGGVTNSGTISGSVYGIAVNNSSISGGITNTIGGTITGAPGQGIVISAGSSVDYISNIGGYINGINNAGTISGAISLGSNAAVDGGINNSGFITGMLGIGIDHSSVAGGITNSGSISGLLAIGVFNSSISGGIANSGLLSGFGGIYITNASVSGGITNNLAGIIEGGSIGGFVTNSQIDFISNNGGTIIGGTTGVLLGYSIVTSGITNSGSIGGSNFGVLIDNSIVNGVSNIGGTIVGGNTGLGIRQSTITGGINNSGSIAGMFGIGITHSSVSGGITNSGLLSGFGGIYITNASVSGGITNNLAGIIEGGSIGGFVTNSQIDFISNNGGTIIGGTTGVLLGYSIVTSGITNSGSIDGSNFGVLIDNSIVNGVSNIGGTIVGGNTGLGIRQATITGGITNSGHIFGGSSTGIYVNRSSVAGGIINSGSILADNVGIVISENSTVDFVRNEGGTIVGNGSAGIGIAYSTITGGIYNSGLISGAWNGLGLDDSTLAGGIYNLGTITGGSNGIGIGYSTISGGITNSGYITGSSYGIFLRSSALNGGIANSGSIDAGITIDNSIITGGITNTGFIQGFFGLELQNGASVDAISNQGTIAGEAAIAVHNATISGGITNSGLLDGAINGLYLANATVTGGINNSGKIVNSFDTTFGPTPAAIFILDSTVTGGITNTGLIASASGSAISISGFSSGGPGAPINVLNTNNGSQVGTIIGAINGYANVTNSGLWALQSYSTTTGYAGLGSIITSFIDGDYHQSSQGTLQFGVTNSGASTAYSTLNVGGTANFDNDATLRVMIAGADIVGAGSIGGQVSAVALSTPSLNIIDNSVLWNFSPVISGGGNTLDLIATASGVTCFGTVSGPVSGPCLVGFDAPSIQVASTGSIGGSTIGIQVLTGLSDGANTLTGGAGYGINNLGTVIGSQTGISFTPSAILTGGVTNSGSIGGDSRGLSLVQSTAANGIRNIGLITGGNTGVTVATNSQVSGGITNSGAIIGGIFGVHVVSNSTIAGGITNNSGTIGGGSAGIFAISHSIVSGGIINSGSIGGGIGGIAAGAYSTITGGIVNSGFISGDVVGISLGISSAVDFISNNGGTISGGTGIQVAMNAVITGGITNSGSIGGVNAGIWISSSAVVNGGIINRGSIGGDTGIVLLDGSTITGGVANSGLIGGGGNGISSINYTTITGGITNSVSGLISGGSSSGIFIGQNSSLDFIVNNGGTISGGNAGISLTAHSSISDGIVNSGFIGGDRGIEVSNYSVITGGITNAGLIASSNVNAIVISGWSSDGTGDPINIINTNNGSQVGTIIGAINGYANVTNSGLWALQSYSTTTGAAALGSVNASNIAGNYHQSSQGTLQFGVTNSGASTAYSTLTVSGTASFDNGSTLKVLISGAGIIGAGSIGGQVSAGTLSAPSLNIIDNSVLWNFSPVISGGGNTLDLIATASGVCAGTAVSGPTTGPCLVGFDAPSIQILGGTNAGVISGSAIGIQVLTGLSDGANTLTGGAGYGINNLGTVIGSQTGISFTPGATLTGGVTNSGLISGGQYALYVDGLSMLTGGINVTGASAKFVGDISAPAVEMNIKSGAAFTNTNAISVNALNIENSATFNFIDGSSTSYGSTSSGALSIGNGIQVASAVNNAGNLNVGTYAPTITGNYVQSSAGTFSSSIASNTNYGRLNVTGSASLAGTAAVTVLNPATILAGGSSTLAGVISAGTLTGKFDRINTTESLLYTFTPVYRGNEFDLAINVTPAPNSNIFAQIVMANNNPAALGAANVLDGFLNNPTANPGMAPVLDRLSSISGTSGGAGVSNAISQTLPALVGAGSLIASQVQQGLNQIMQGRQNQLRGLSSGEEYIGNRNAWMKGYGSWANQDSHNNVSGYRVNTGGLAIGVDAELSPKANLGAVFAFGNSSVNGNNAAAASGMTVNSYQLGVYGDYAIRPDIHVNYQANLGLNNNKEYRNLSAFNGVQGVASGSGGINANANYNSYIGHLGTGVRKFVPLTENTTFIPAFRLDYTTVQSQGYTETGAGTLNLSANSQTYNALLTSADLRVDHMLVNSLKLSANIGAGYNTLNNQVQMTAAYQGGGPAFTTNGLQTSPWIYNAGLGISGRLTKDVEMNVRYDTQLSTTGYNNQLVSAKIKFFY